jgi:hypothetical protein
MKKPETFYCGTIGDCYPKQRMDRWLKEMAKKVKDIPYYNNAESVAKELGGMK